MTAPSPRYWLPVALLLGVAAAPVWSNAGGARDREDCANPYALRDPEAFGNVSDDPEDVQLVARQWWNAGAVHIGGPTTPLLRYALLRSHRPGAIVLRPQNFLDRTIEPERTETEWLDAGDHKIPVTFVYDRTRPLVRFAAYLTVYRGEAVEHPFAAQVRSVVPQLIEGPAPLSLYIIGGGVNRIFLHRAEDRARTWLVDAWKHHRGSCEG